MFAMPCVCGALSPPAGAHARASRSLRRRAAQHLSAHAAPPRPRCAPRAAAGGGDAGGSGGGGGRGRGGGGFVAGVLVGGALFGALGLLFAPQISSALLRGRDALRLPRFGEGDGEDGSDPLEAQRSNLNEKIAELNAAIDEFSLEVRVLCVRARALVLGGGVRRLGCAAALRGGVRCRRGCGFVLGCVWGASGGRGARRALFGVTARNQPTDCASRGARLFRGRGAGGTAPPLPSVQRAHSRRRTTHHARARFCRSR
jgi:hypothetical protein